MQSWLAVALMAVDVGGYWLGLIELPIFLLGVVGAVGLALTSDPCAARRR